MFCLPFYPLSCSILHFSKPLQITDKCALGMSWKSRLCLVGKQLSSLRHIFTKSIHHWLKILSFKLHRKNARNYEVHTTFFPFIDKLLGSLCCITFSYCFPNACLTFSLRYLIAKRYVIGS